MKISLGIYIHIPFCVKKCLYCDFLSFSPEAAMKMAGSDAKIRYMEALQREIEKEAGKYQKHRVDTVFIGGGTPSLLEVQWIEKILCKLKNEFDFSENPEITIEVNPGTVTEEKLAGYRTAGINRLSIGTQSVRDEELKRLGRIHCAEDFFRTYEQARHAGFVNINVDVMSALPGQDCRQYMETLSTVVRLKPEHISAYGLIIEEGTPFYDKYAQDKSELPSEEEERNMYEETGRFLEEYGYGRYEISNYALEGMECRHNISYWNRSDYAGFGLGASSMVENVRWKNEEDLCRYIERTEKKEIHRLSAEEQMEEFMFLGLRLTKGVMRTAFLETFGRRIDDVYGQTLKNLERQQLIVNRENIRLTPYGRDISNYVMAQFLF